MSTHKTLATMRLPHWLFIAFFNGVFSPASASEDNLLAHSLFEAGEYVRAAEIFTDPAWKGAALYRSEQWWRAAEAFIRANDPISAFNLGNCYVKMSYFELALEAYQNALTMDPRLDDAAHNANIMRQLLAQEDEQQRNGGRQPSGDEIERLDTQDEQRERGDGQSGEDQSETGDSAPERQTDEQGQQSQSRSDQAKPGQGSHASEQDKASNEQPGNGSLSGETSEGEPPVNQPSGGSESDINTGDSQAAGLRTALEAEQATAQWLNRINHDASLFLQKRIALEQRRRQAAGQSAPEGGSSW